MAGARVMGSLPAPAVAARAGPAPRASGPSATPVAASRAAFLGSSRSGFSGANAIRTTAGMREREGRRGVVVFAADDGEEEGGTTRIRRKKQEKEKKEASVSDINPVELGRRSREAFNTIWRGFSRLGQMGASTDFDERFMVQEDVEFIRGGAMEYEAPQAAYTSVLVVGATGKVGKVLVRKLLLRGYTVKALVRPGTATDEKLAEIPTKVEVVEGTVGDLPSLAKAMVDVDKVICCIRAKSDLTAELDVVENRGVGNLTRAFLDAKHRTGQTIGQPSSKVKKTLFKFKKEAAVDAWKMEHVGLPQGMGAPSMVPMPASRESFTANSRVDFKSNGDGQAVFAGGVYQRGGIAQAGADLQMPSGEGFKGYEGLVMRLLGDGKSYVAELRSTTGMKYVARFNTRMGWNTVRLPFSNFRPIDPTHPPMDIRTIDHLSLRFETRRQRTAASGGGQGTDNRFSIAIDFIKAMPACEEPDFVLVSCTGAAASTEDARSRLVQYKRMGEAQLRNSGLSYTVVRPGRLFEEPGGQRALVFDQGDRIQQGISCADVADVCVKALHNDSAVNKSFDVCYENATAGGQTELYELVAHLPEKSNNYLTPALATLEKNT